MTDSNNYAQRLSFAIIPILIFVYALPVIVAAIEGLSGTLVGSGRFGVWFISLISNPDSALNLFHKVLIPITSGLTVATMWRGQHARWTVAMVLGLVIAIALAIYLLVDLGIPDVQRNLWQPASNPAITSDAQLYNLASNYVGRVQETLATYMLILLGLQAIPREN
jgi:hypothetical protein